MTRTAGTYVTSTTSGETVQAFVPNPLLPSDPSLVPVSFIEANRVAELALARLSGVSGLVPSVDWLLYGAIRKEALLTSQIEGTQATLADLFDEEAGFTVSNTDDVEEVTNYLRAFRLVQDNLRDPKGLPTPFAYCARLTGYFSMAHAVLASSLVNYAARRTGSEAPGRAMQCLCRRQPTV